MDDFRNYFCPSCKKVLTIPARYGGRLMPCPFCGRLQRTPAAPFLAAAPPAARPSCPGRRFGPNPPRNRRRALVQFVLVTMLLLVGMVALRLAMDRPRPAPHVVNGARADGRRQAELNLGEWQRKLDAWQARQRTAREVLARLEADETETLDRLAGLGVKSAADVRGNGKAQVYAEELQEIVRQEAAARRTCDEWDEAVARLESVLRRSERARAMERTGITDREKADLQRTVLELDDRVGRMTAGAAAGREPDLDALLKDKLGQGP